MPLYTQVRRNGRTRNIRWGGFHVAAMTLAAAIDSKEGELYRLLAKDEPTILEADPIELGPGDVWNLVGYHVLAATPLNNGSYEMQGTMTFVDLTDGEKFVLKRGDELVAYRSA